MCLYKILPPPLPSAEQVKFGYKVFTKVPGGPDRLLGMIYTLREGGYLPNVWYDDMSPMCLATTDFMYSYETGFHVYQNKEDAEERLNSFRNKKYFVIKMVEIEGIHTHGLEHDSIVFVCRRMRICA